MIVTRVSYRSWLVEDNDMEYMVWIDDNNKYKCNCMFYLRRLPKRIIECKHIKEVKK